MRFILLVFQMTLKVRFAFLFALLLAALLCGLFLLRKTHEREASKLITDAREEHTRLLEEVLALTAYPLDQFVRDYSQWDDMVRFTEAPDATWAKVNIEASLTPFRLHAAWVCRADGGTVYQAGANERGAAVDRGLSADEVAALVRQNKFPRFFTLKEGVLLEIRAAPIQPSNDTARATAPRGWLFGARAWDRAQLDALGRLTGANVSLEKPATTEGNAKPALTIERALHGKDGQTLATLFLTYAPASAGAAQAFNEDEVLIFIIHGALMLLLTIGCLQLWVIAPVRRITESLRTNDSAPIKSIAQQKNEAGQIARLVESHFADHAASAKSERLLAHSLAERVRLGRDLHDNVIQALFAAGMSVAAARDLIRSDPGVAEKELGQIGNSLNAVIRDVRTFIIGLEPESLDLRTFSQSVNDMVNALRSIHPVTFTCQIDDTAAEKLPLDLRQHSLQTLRESVLNSLRHAAARHIQIACESTANGVHIQLGDDGAPLTPNGNRPGDQTLRSVVERAIIVGAQAHVRNPPKGGTELQLTYPVSNFPQA